MADSRGSLLVDSLKQVLLGVFVIASVILPVFLVLGATIGVFSLLIWFNTNAIKPLLGDIVLVSIVFYGICLSGWFWFIYWIATDSSHLLPYNYVDDFTLRYP